LEKLYSKELSKHANKLRLNLADFLSFEEIVVEIKAFKERASILI